jgi:hypothetical protein
MWLRTRMYALMATSATAPVQTARMMYHHSIRTMN